MTATLIPTPKFHADDSTGAPLVGGKVWTFDTGTANPRTTYTDATATVPNTNPVILDARGEADIWLSGVYRIQLLDATDVQQWVVDDVASSEALVAAAAISLLTGTSTTSLLIETAPKTFTTQAGKYFLPGANVLVVSDADPTVDYMFGKVSAYSGTTLDVDVEGFGGTGTHADWTIMITGERGVQGPQGIPGVTGGGDMLNADNLQFLTNFATARSNLGLGTMAVQNANNVNITGGTITGVPGIGTSVAAWVNFIGSSGTIRRSSNVSSVTRAGIGSYTVNFTTPMADANYAVNISVSSLQINPATGVHPRIISQTAASATFFVNYGTSSYAPYDPDIICVSVFS